VVAIVVNLPSQFGIVGTDAGAEFLMSGTAISMPLIPVVSLLVVVAFGGRRDRWRWLGVAAGYFTALRVSIGGFGELTGEPTDDTPAAVLVGAGIVFLAVGLALFVLSTATAVRPPPDNRAQSFP
jgi:formate hydrogenlyase subunit 3/multisubunit Na+/H+ antiporter MnhD subunit